MTVLSTGQGQVPLNTFLFSSAAKYTLTTKRARGASGHHGSLTYHSFAITTKERLGSELSFLKKIVLYVRNVGDVCSAVKNDLKLKTCLYETILRCLNNYLDFKCVIRFVYP